MSCHANMQCKSTVWTSKKLAAAAAEERRDDSNSIQSNPARGGGGVNRLIIPVHEQIQQQVDHQMAPDLSQVITSWSLSAPSLCVGGYVYASTTVSFFSRDFRERMLYPCRIPMNSIISFRVCAESCIHRSWSSVHCHYSSVGSFTIACLLAALLAPGKRQPAVQRNMHAPRV